MSDDLELVIKGPEWWDSTTTLRLKLRERGNPGRYYLLAAEQGGQDGNCSVRMERIAPTDAAIRCVPEKGSRYTVHKFVFDPRAKALVGRVTYEVMPFQRVTRTQAGAIFRGPQPFAVRYAKGSFRVLKAEPMEQSAQPSGTGTGRPAPQSTWDEFAKARPRRVKDGYVREGTNIEEYIGPQQKYNGVLWFGKTFYDGEGTSGVGGFGYFDGGALRLYSPPAIADWSVTAILVEDDAVWLGLASCGEWATNAGGLLRFDRATETVRRIELPDVIGDIERDGDRLLLATDFGLAIVENERVRRYFVDRLTDGRLRVAEALKQF